MSDPCTVLFTEAEDGFCPQLEAIDVGTTLVSIDPTSDCPKELSGRGIPVQDDSGVALKTGADGSRIVTPEMHVIPEGQVQPVLLGMDTGGGWQGLLPNPEDQTKAVITRQGGFFVGDIPPTLCFDQEEVCECTPDFIAGWQVSETDEDGNSTICLVRIPLDFFNVEINTNFADTPTVDITGSGTPLDPFQANVKVSAQSGNLIEVNSDGLYVPCCYPPEEEL